MPPPLTTATTTTRRTTINKENNLNYMDMNLNTYVYEEYGIWHGILARWMDGWSGWLESSSLVTLFGNCCVSVWLA